MTLQCGERHHINMQIKVLVSKVRNFREVCNMFISEKKGNLNKLCKILKTCFDTNGLVWSICPTVACDALYSKGKVEVLQCRVINEAITHPTYYCQQKLAAPNLTLTGVPNLRYGKRRNFIQMTVCKPGTLPPVETNSGTLQRQREGCFLKGNFPPQFPIGTFLCKGGIQICTV